MDLRSYFKGEGIDLWGALPFENCKVYNRRLLSQISFPLRSALIIAIPYYTGTKGGNLSLYAMSKDYHLYTKELSSRLLPVLSALYPANHFALFSDHAPIDERSAAALSGLGSVGDNGLLITEKYGSFVFLCEVLSDLDCKDFPEADQKKSGKTECLHCGACKKACPCHFEDCASGIGQKKGTLTPEEEELVLKTGLVWGCDLCQTSCPLNRRAEKTSIPFFYEDRIENLTPEILERLQGNEFQTRAFAWRGRKTVERNLELFNRAK